MVTAENLPYNFKVSESALVSLKLTPEFGRIRVTYLKTITFLRVNDNKKPSFCTLKAFDILGSFMTKLLRRPIFP